MAISCVHGLFSGCHAQFFVCDDRAGESLPSGIYEIMERRALAEIWPCQITLHCKHSWKRARAWLVLSKTQRPATLIERRATAAAISILAQGVLTEELFMRFSIRDMLLITTIAAVAVGWWLSNRHHVAAVERLKAESEIAKTKAQADLSLLEDRYENLLPQYKSLEAHYRFQQKVLMRRFSVATQGRNRLGLRELYQRFVDDRSDANSEQAAHGVLEEFKRAVHAELEMLEVDWSEDQRPATCAPRIE